MIENELFDVVLFDFWCCDRGVGSGLFGAGIWGWNERASGCREALVCMGFYKNVWQCGDFDSFLFLRDTPFKV